MNQIVDHKKHKEVVEDNARWRKMGPDFCVEQRPDRIYSGTCLKCVFDEGFHTCKLGNIDIDIVENRILCGFCRRSFTILDIEEHIKLSH